MKLSFKISLVAAVASTAFTLFFLVKALEHDALVRSLIDRTLSNRVLPSRMDTVLALSNAIYTSTNRGLERDSLDWYDRWESTSFFNVTSAVSLKYSGFGVRGHVQFGPCGTMSRVLLNALWTVGIPARKLHLLSGTGHTMVEFSHERRWIVISPSDSSFIWRLSDGRPATVQEIANNPLVFRDIYLKRPGFQYTFDSTANIRWAKLPRLLHKTVQRVMGQEAFASMETPRWYETPRTLFLFLSVIFSFPSVLMASVLWYRRTPKKSTEPHPQTQQESVPANGPSEEEDTLESQ